MVTISGMNVSIRRGDSGGFDIRTSGYVFGTDDRALFTIKDANNQTIRRELLPITDGVVAIDFTVAETKSMRYGDYKWDVRFITDPVYDENDQLIGGQEVDTPYTDLRLTIGRTVGDI